LVDDSPKEMPTAARAATAAPAEVPAPNISGQYISMGNSLSSDNSQVVFTFPTITSKLLGERKQDVLKNSSVEVTAYLGGNVQKIASGRVTFILTTQASATKVFGPLADHIVASEGTVAVAIAKGNDPITIEVQGATLDSITPGIVAGVPSPQITLQVPLKLPVRATDSCYTFKLSDLSAEQVVTFTITNDNAKKNDPSYQAEVETVRVVNAGRK
jgi:hypothetical protein